MMKILKKTLPILFVLFFFLVLIKIPYSLSLYIKDGKGPDPTGCERTNLNIQIVPSQIDSGLKNVLLNLSVNSPLKNATTLNINLSSVFSFVENSNGTSENATFTFYSSENILSWKNTTVLGFLNSSGWFSFNVSTSEISNSTSYTITVNINNVDDTCYYDETSVSLIASIWSKSNKFYVTPRGTVNFFPLQNLYLFDSSIFLGNITFYLKSLSTLNLSIKNTSYVFKPLYAQDELYSSDCFQNSNLFLVKINDTYSNETQIKGSANLTIISKDTCPPGLYSVNFTIFETTNESESLVLPFKLNIPISDKNLIEDDKATVKGKIASGRHEFVLLLPSSNYSFISWYFYSTNSSDKILFYDFSNNIRGYGVSGSRGYIDVGNSKKFLIKIFSTDHQLHKISFDISLIPLNVTENGVPLDKINFTVLKEDENLTKEISLENYGNKAYEFNVSARLFKKLTFSSSASTTFNFFVHPSVVEMYARLEWNDKGNYSMKLINPNELIVNSSYMASENDYNWMELYFDNPESGLWKVDVDKFDGGSYNLSVLLVLNESEFIHLHNSSFILNGFESGNVSITLKIPESSPSGLIEGEVKFDMNASHFILPLEVYANTTEFVVNNDYENIEAYAEDNIGFNRTGENNITLILNISNIGTLPFSISLVNFSSRLNNTLNSSWFVRVSNVSIQRAQVDVGNYSLVNVTLYVLTNETLNKEGKYVGDLWLNFSSEEGNELVKSILVLNLSSLLKLRIISIDPNIVSTSENLIIEVVPKYL
ncbi:MAG: hypothetical protein J7L39_03135, partial [Candidatus Aenigmarchaeota archaeon]|nr:hypothetical protein [Candidatus Aenigmarchaeota archaeon]